MKKNTAYTPYRFLLLLTIAVVIWWLFLNIRGHTLTFALGALTAGILVVGFRRKLLEMVKKAITWRYFPVVMWTIIGLAITSRLLLALLPHAPLSDMKAVFDVASSLAQGENPLYGLEYFARFPYLTLYPSLLAFFFRLFGANHFSVILFNTILYMLNASVIFLLLKNWTKSRKLALLGSTLYLANPLLIFATSSSYAPPLTVVFLITTLY